MVDLHVFFKLVSSLRDGFLLSTLWKRHLCFRFRLLSVVFSRWQDSSPFFGFSFCQQVNEEKSLIRVSVNRSCYRIRNGFGHFSGHFWVNLPFNILYICKSLWFCWNITRDVIEECNGNIDGTTCHSSSCLLTVGKTPSLLKCDR